MKTTTSSAIAALAILALAACGGGSGSVPPVSSPTTSPTAAPTSKPSAAPSASPAPTATPTASPTASPTAVPLALRVMGGAPTTATVAQLQSSARTSAGKVRTSQSAQGTTNGLPILVESSGMVATWAGDLGIWATNAQTQENLSETGMTVTPSGNLPIDDPGPQPLACVGQLSGICIVHPTAWTFGTSSANGKTIGQQTIAITFADGTTGTTYDDVYDGWGMQCGAGWAYSNGVPIATTTVASSDVYADCADNNIVFPKGATLADNPIADQYGNYATQLPTVTATILMPVLVVNVPMSAITPGQIYGVQTQDGGVAKVYMTSQANASAPMGVLAIEGMALHAQSNGAYPF